MGFHFGYLFGLTERTRTTGRRHSRQDLHFEAEAKRYSTSLNTKFMNPIKTTQVAVIVQSADTTLKSKLVYFEARFAVNQILPDEPKQYSLCSVNVLYIQH